MISILDPGSISLVVICLAGAALHVSAVWLKRPLISALAKAVASTSFVVLGTLSGGGYTSYGRFILAALVLSWVGDMLLLSLQSYFLLAGIAAFLLAHAAFAAGFTRLAIDGYWFAGGIVCTSVAGVLLVRWLWVRLEGSYRIAVPIYVATIMMMTSLAIGVSAAQMPATVAAGAILFTVSDISVARDRFIERSVVNKVWGIPLYYIAQLLLAASVAAATA